MNLDSNSDGMADTITSNHGDNWADRITTSSGAGDGPVSGMDRRRVDLRRVLTRVRHLPGSSEPARVFTELAAACVPALCDLMVIDIDETGTDQASAHRYRIRQPGWLPPPAIDIDDPFPEVEPGQVVAAGQQVTGVVGSLPGGGHQYTARLVCRWAPGYVPTETDAALVGVLADHAVALVHRERTTGHIAHTDTVDTVTAHQVGAALGRAQRVAAATGILMALHHLTSAQARQLLDRAGDRTHQTLVQVADTVLRTGSLPDQRTTRPPGTPVTAAPNPDAHLNGHHARVADQT